MGSFTSWGGVRLSLQWISVSSRSNTMHLRSKHINRVYFLFPFWEACSKPAFWFPNRWVVMTFKESLKYAATLRYVPWRGIFRLSTPWLSLRRSKYCVWGSKGCVRKCGVLCVRGLGWLGLSRGFCCWDCLGYFCVFTVTGRVFLVRVFGVFVSKVVFVFIRVCVGCFFSCLIFCLQ